MPIGRIDPEKFYTYRGITIYRTYGNDDANNPLTYWFTTDISEDEDLEFDIRELDKTLDEKGLMPDELIELETDPNEYAAIIRLGLDNELIPLADDLELTDEKEPVMPYLDQYIADGETCPFCGVKGMQEGRSVETGAAVATQPMSCPECENSWTDQYILINSITA